MDKPLLLQPINGKSENQNMYYDKADTHNDEVEDLYSLLSRAKQEYGVQAVSSGAILSDYQRLRIENVCDRLGLISLAYLWQRDQSELLDAMIENHIEAKIVKVAWMGLNQKFLMKSIEELRDSLHKLNQQYQINVCGEGGEFETVVFDWPLFLTKKIIADEYTVIDVSDDDYAPVSHVYLKTLSLVDKENQHEPIELYKQEECKQIEHNHQPTPISIQFEISKSEVSINPQLLYKNSECFHSKLISLSELHNYYFGKEQENRPETVQEETDLLLNYLSKFLESNGKF